MTPNCCSFSLVTKVVYGFFVVVVVLGVMEGDVETHLPSWSRRK